MGRAVIVKLEDTPENAQVVRLLASAGLVVMYVEAGSIFVAGRNVNKATVAKFAAKQRQ